MNTASKRVQLFGVLLLLGLPAWVFAQGSPPPAAETAFRDIFGVDPTSLASIVRGSGGTVISAVSKVINVVALTSAVFVMVLTFLTGLAQSAHEGVVMGRRYSSLWVPVRAALGLGFLTPLPGGYSFLQAIVIWIGTLGSGFADQAWTASMEFMAQEHPPTNISATSDQRALVNAVFESAVCAARLNAVAAVAAQTGTVNIGVAKKNINKRIAIDKSGILFGALWGGAGGAISAGMKATMIQGGVSYDGTKDIDDEEGFCGEVMIERSVVGGLLAGSSMASAMTEVRNIQGMAADIDATARAVAIKTMTTEEIRAALLGVETRFAVAEKQRLLRYQADADVALRDGMVKALQQSSASGWMSAGAYYITLAGVSDVIHDTSGANLVTHGPQLEKMPKSLRTDMQPYLDMASARSAFGSRSGSVGDGAQKLIPIGLIMTAGRLGSGDAGGSIFKRAWGGFTSMVSEKSRGLFNALVSALIGTPGSDPVLSMMEFGHSTLLIVEGILVAGIASGAALGITLVGTVAGLAIIGSTFTLVVALGTPLVLIAYYLPMLPLIYWVYGIIGWLLLLLEAVAIAPMWAAAHVLPEGEGLAGQHARQGWVIMVSLLLRPILMVMGFVAAVVIMRFMSLLVSSLFNLFIDASMAGRVFGILSTIVYTIALVGLVVGLSRAVFSLIHVVPDRALRFLGGGDALGEMGAEGNTRQGGAMAAGALGVGVGLGARLGGLGRTVNDALQKRRGGDQSIGPGP